MKKIKKNKENERIFINKIIYLWTFLFQIAWFLETESYISSNIIFETSNVIQFLSNLTFLLI